MKIDEMVRKVNTLIDLYNKDKQISLLDLQIDYNDDEWFVVMGLLAMNSEKPSKRIEHITESQLKDMCQFKSQDNICVVCGKKIEESESYFIFDGIGYFCEDCSKTIK